MERHHAGGPFANLWLMTAIDRHAPGAAGRALELARLGAPGSEEVAVFAMSRLNLNPHTRNTNYYDLADLRIEDLRVLADRLARGALREPRGDRALRTLRRRRPGA
jgi:hypothetical protein